MNKQKFQKSKRSLIKQLAKDCPYLSKRDATRIVNGCSPEMKRFLEKIEHSVKKVLSNKGKKK